MPIARVVQANHQNSILWVRKHTNLHFLLMMGDRSDYLATSDRRGNLYTCSTKRKFTERTNGSES